MAIPVCAAPRNAQCFGKTCSSGVHATVGFGSCEASEFGCAMSTPDHARPRIHANKSYDCNVADPPEGDEQSRVLPSVSDMMMRPVAERRCVTENCDLSSVKF